jgi:tetratricopeptide (TPR) repeat protein
MNFRLKSAECVLLSFLATISGAVSIFALPSPCKNQIASPSSQKTNEGSTSGAPHRAARSISSYLEVLTSPVHANSLDALTNDIRQHPESALNLVYRGGAYLSDGDATNALADFKKALSIDPNCAKAHIGISRVCEIAKKYPGAFFELDQAMKSGNQSTKTKVLWESARLHREVNDYDKSLALYAQLINTKDLSAAEKSYAYFQRGEVYLRTHKNPAALADFTSSIRLDPNLMAAHGTRAAIYIALNKPKEALADFDAIIAVGSQYDSDDIFNDLPSQQLIDTYRHRADLYQKLGKTDLAEADRKTIKKLEKKVFDGAPMRTNPGY